jgi:hypothetical protein
MGIGKESILTMCYADLNGVDFKDTLMIGRQNVFIRKEEIYGLLKNYDPNRNNSLRYIDKIFEVEIPYAEELFKYFGALKVDSIDYSDYEGANIIHDMNIPIKDDLKNKYSCVWDGGTLEHVFNYPIAIKNCMDMVRGGGHLVLETPANNFLGHGFYQFSPELFFSLLNEDNGFTDTKIFMSDDGNNFYEVIPPKLNKCRTEFDIAKHVPSLMRVISKKIDNVPDVLSISQSDYVDAWDENDKFKNYNPSSTKLRTHLYEKTPMILKPLILSLWHSYISRIYNRRRINEFYIPMKEFSKPKK